MCLHHPAIRSKTEWLTLEPILNDCIFTEKQKGVYMNDKLLKSTLATISKQNAITGQYIITMLC